MPILAEKRGLYPQDWPEISRRIREERAGGRCECVGECGTPHPEGRCLERDREPALWAQPPALPELPALGLSKAPPIPIEVVLTVAHLDQWPPNCTPSNLLALCQRCHNRLDGVPRAATRQRRALEAREAAGQVGILMYPHGPARPRKRLEAQRCVSCTTLAPAAWGRSPGPGGLQLARPGIWVAARAWACSKACGLDYAARLAAEGQRELAEHARVCALGQLHLISVGGPVPSVSHPPLWPVDDSGPRHRAPSFPTARPSTPSSPGLRLSFWGDEGEDGRARSGETAC